VARRAGLAGLGSAHALADDWLLFRVDGTHSISTIPITPQMTVQALIAEARKISKALARVPAQEVEAFVVQPTSPGFPDVHERLLPHCRIYYRCGDHQSPQTALLLKRTSAGAANRTRTPLAS
jgi:hypothetical protein